MNCKPGDLARIVAAGIHQDKIIRLTTIDPQCVRDGLPPAWLYEPPLLPDPCEPDAFDMVSFFDHHLRPIRDPGEDARDEMLRPLPQEITA